MKKQILYLKMLCIFSLISLKSIAQVNEYLDHNPVWQINSQCAFFYPCIETQTFNYYVNGDTVINALVYKKIFKAGNGYHWSLQPPPNNCPNFSFSYVDTVPSFFLRSSGKKMYILNPGLSSDTLLYDFNLNLGDTLPLTYNNYNADTWVSAIDSISTPYGYRKRFSLSGGSWAQYLFEGVGHSKGLIEPVHVPLECGFDLLCFSLNDTAYFPNAGPTCFLAVNVSDKQREDSFSVMPNPSDKQCQIFFDEAQSKAEIFLLNALGQKIILNANFNGNKFDADVSALDDGIYILMVMQDNEVKFSKKLLIAH